MLYVDLETILGDLRRDLEGPQLDLVQTLQNNLPEVLTSSATLFDMGVKVAGSFESTGTIGETPSNALTSTEYLPSDTLAFLSTTGVSEIWAQIREQLEDTLELPFGFDQLTGDFEQETGLNLDTDIFGWMTGETAFAFLPSTFTLGSFGVVEEALIRALAMIEFADRAAVGSALDKIINTLEDQGITFESVTIDGEEALLADLRDIFGNSDIQPGYVILENHVVVGTTQQSIQLALDTRKGELQSLGDAPAFKRALGESTGTDFVLYFNVGGIVDLILDNIDPSGQADYEEQVAPFLDPIEAFLLGVGADDELTTWTAVLTFE